MSADPTPCPHADVCQRCPNADDDDACMWTERALMDRAEYAEHRLRVALEALRAARFYVDARATRSTGAAKVLAGVDAVLNDTEGPA